MLLTVDIGNSHIVVGAYPMPGPEEPAGPEPEPPVAVWRLSSDPRRTEDEYRLLLRRLWEEQGYRAESFGDAVLCSVVAPLTDIWAHLLERQLGRAPLLVDHTLELGISLGVDRPDSVGRDRLADAVAGYERTQGPAIVVDFGTATTFNVVSREGTFLGGAIAPGLGTVTDALVRRASALPAVELAPPPQAIGRSTVPAIQSGLIYGYVGLVEGLLARLVAELGERPQVHATGGLGHIIAPLTSAIHRYDPWLTLAGMRSIYRRNRGCPPS